MTGHAAEAESPSPSSSLWVEPWYKVVVVPGGNFLSTSTCQSQCPLPRPPNSGLLGCLSCCHLVAQVRILNWICGSVILASFLKLNYHCLSFCCTFKYSFSSKDRYKCYVNIYFSFFLAVNKCLLVNISRCIKSVQSMKVLSHCHLLSKLMNLECDHFWLIVIILVALEESSPLQQFTPVSLAGQQYGFSRPM